MTDQKGAATEFEADNFTQSLVAVKADTEMMRHYLTEIFREEIATERGSRPFAGAVFAPDPRSEDADTRMRSFINAIDTGRPQALVVISSADVYDKAEGEDITERENIRPTARHAQALARAEEMAMAYSSARKIPLAILRCAPAFGNYIAGPWERLFASVSTGRFILARDCSAFRSLVTALDVARVAKALMGIDGIFNVADGRTHSVVDIVSALAQNGGKDKRPVWLPLKWYKIVAALGNNIPALGTCACTRSLEFQQRTLTFSTRRLEEAIDFPLYDTTAVIARTDNNYPYEDI